MPQTISKFLENKLGGFVQKHGQSFKGLGKSADPILPIVICCVWNGTVQSALMMGNKKEPLKNRQYSALRNTVQEFLSLGICLTFSAIFQKGIAKLFIKARDTGLTKGPTTNLMGALGVITSNLAIPILTTLALGKFLKHSSHPEEKPQSRSSLNLRSISPAPAVMPLGTRLSNRLNGYSVSTDPFSPFRTGASSI